MQGKKVLAVIITVVLTLSIFMGSAFATSGTPVVDATYVLDSSDVWLSVSGTSTITSDGTEYTNVKIDCASGTILTIENLNINNSASANSVISVSGAVSLNITGVNTLTAGTNHAAVEVIGASAVSIDGAGKLTVQGGDYGAGIGGGYQTSGGNIVITGGTIDATGGSDGAGIGQGYYGGYDDTTPMTISISGGDILANGTDGGAGIGYGYGTGYNTGTTAMTINISGTAEIEAIGGTGGAGIGFGDYCEDDTMIINILGGTIYARSADEGAGIGAGDEYCCEGSIYSTINIFGGWIYAEGYCCGAGIGAGDDAGWGTINITGGVVNAWADSEDDIGEGCCGWIEEGVYISGDAIVFPQTDYMYSSYSTSSHSGASLLLYAGGVLVPVDTEVVLESLAGETAETWLGCCDGEVYANLPDGTYFFTKDDGASRTQNFTISGAYFSGSLEFVSAQLGQMVISEGTLDPSFDSGTYEYSVTVGNEIESLIITPTLLELDDSLTVEGIAVVSGSPSGEIALSEGKNTLEIVVTDGTDTSYDNTYTIYLYRELGPGPDISGTLHDELDNPLVGWSLVLESTPVRVTTDDAGVFLFSPVTLGDHTLTIIDPSSNEIAVYQIVFIPAGSFAWRVADGTIFIDITPQTAGVDIEIEVGEGTSIEDVTERIGNPDTGDSANYTWLWIALAAMLLLAVGTVVVKKSLNR